MTDDGVDLDAERRARIEQLRQRRTGARPAPNAARAGSRPGPGGPSRRGATGGRIAATGLGVASMLGLVAAMGRADRAGATDAPPTTAPAAPALVVVVHRPDTPPTTSAASADDTSDATTSGPPPATDGGSSSSGGMAGECDAAFDTAADYVLCEETDTTCSFNVTLDQTSCTDLCGTFGVACVDAFENSASDCASQGASVGCDAVAMDNICVCSKP